MKTYLKEINPQVTMMRTSPNMTVAVEQDIKDQGNQIVSAHLDIAYLFQSDSHYIDVTKI